MKKVFLLLISVWLITPEAYSQNGELPAVRFPAGKNICDDSAWQLVFKDYFDGNTLAPDWLTFNSWAGMPGGDHEHWAEARCVYPFNAIYKDDNIEVSNGTVKLYLKKEPATWQCTTCTTARKTNYTNATIALPYTKPFNAGRFEARIKMPTFKWAHSTFWTYMGNTVNEIDIAESYGVSGVPAWPVFKYAPTCNYSLHAWDPPADENPYKLRHTDITNRYPGRHWYDWLAGKYFKQDDFHTYTCEWDTTVVRLYLDGKLVNELWKYYRERNHTRKEGASYRYKAASGCNPEPGTWRVSPGFPFNNQSASNLRFTIAIDNEDNQHPDGVLGAMEIDYVKIWQRHPEGPWTKLNDSGTRASHRSFLPPSPTAEHPGGNATIVCSETHHAAERTARYNLYAGLQLTGTTAYEWDINYGPGLSRHYQASGPFISTPAFIYTRDSTNKIRWTLRITNNNSTIIKTGQMNYDNMKPTPDAGIDKDVQDIYVVAAIPDYAVYKQAVQQQLSARFINVNETEDDIDQLISQIEMQELAPYILPDSILNGKANQSRECKDQFESTRVYSGPSSGRSNTQNR